MKNFLMASALVEALQDMIEKNGDRPVLLDVKIDDKYHIFPIASLCDAYIGESKDNSDLVYSISNHSGIGEIELNS